ncbi:MAG: OmpH family outer membrane protein [Deltaproteobacteria bacterium]|jgi:outer membrane protein|nr:OmpH family outer membrane protein [Deltaproteobacteria bacterium]
MDKRVTIGVVVALASTFFRLAPAQAADPQIGYVSLQRAILEVEEGKRAKDKLKKTFEKKQGELTKKEADLKALKDQIDSKSTVANEDDKTKAQKAEFQNKLMELQQTFMKEQQELQAQEQKELSGITERMRGVIKDIGNAGGYQLILEIQDSRLLFAKPHLDLTNEVIRKYNAKYK